MRPLGLVNNDASARSVLSRTHVPRLPMLKQAESRTQPVAYLQYQPIFQSLLNKVFMAKSQISAAVPYAWPYDGSFSRETTALVIIDMQNDFCTEGGYITHQGYDISGTRAIIPKIQFALHAFRQAGWQVYHTREGDSVPRFKLLHAYSPDPKQYKAIVLTSQRSPLERHSVRETTPRAKESVHRVRWEADCSSAEARDTTPSLSSIL